MGSRSRGVNPCLHIDQVPPDFPESDRLWTVDEEKDEMSEGCDEQGHVRNLDVA